MKKLLKVLLILIILGCVCAGGAFGLYKYMLTAPSKSDETVNIYIDKGSSYNKIAGLLKENGLIRNEYAYKIYLKFNEPKKLEYGDYIIKQNLSVEELIKVLEEGSTSLATTKKITFVEGKNMRYVIKKITESFPNIKEEDILNKLKDTEYLDKIINKYLFLTDDIKNDKLYYSLEGYLYPDTYEFYETAGIEDIFNAMLDNMHKKLKDYKEEIEKSNRSVHEMITLASIIELEAGKADDRKGVAGVFYNRLADNWSLGSDVTTYYAAKVDLSDRDLYKSEINECNDYNTRNTCMAGKLPVGPICNPSINSLIAAFEPTDHDYYYFVADKNGKTYFNETYSGHEKTVAQLKKDGLWYEYDN